jgi:hypothetical protein
MAATFEPERNKELALPALFSKFGPKIEAVKAHVQRLNGGSPLQVVPAEWTDCWIVRFLIGFKEDPELAGQVFFDAQKWREQKGMEAIRQKIVQGLQPADFPHAAKVMPFYPKVIHGRCRHNLPVEYNFVGSIEPELLLKAASFDELFEFFLYDTEYKLNMLMTESLERNILIRLQAIFDGKGFALSKHLNRKNVGVLKKVMDEITPRYVEMSEKVQIINCPYAKVVKPIVNYVVPARALYKFSIAGSAWQEGVAMHIDPAQLHPCMKPDGPSVHDALGISAVDTTQAMTLQKVEAGKKVDLTVPVPAGMDVVYSFISEGHDVGLKITFEPASSADSVEVGSAVARSGGGVGASSSSTMCL